jgi:sterol 24-C-methyltransferase
MPLADETFDAAYAIEATCYAPSLKDSYRVLKPGATFGLYEVIMTHQYDDNNPTHREVRHGIERGDGVTHVVTAVEAITALMAAGFKLLSVSDLAGYLDQIPWQKQLSTPLVVRTLLISLATLEFFYFARGFRYGNAIIIISINQV